MFSDRLRKFYINGTWVDPIGTKVLEVENPATEKVLGVVAMGATADADRAIAAARAS